MNCQVKMTDATREMTDCQDCSWDTATRTVTTCTEHCTICNPR